MTAARAQAKTLILRWFDKGKPGRALRKRVSRDIDRFFDSIAARDNWCECMSTLLDDKGAANFTLAGDGWRARPSGKGLVVTSIVPGWAFGWRGVLQDEIAEDMLSWIGHYARQYIHRSNIAKVLMAAWERHDLVLHPFGHGVILDQYGAKNPAPSAEDIFAAAEAGIVRMWGPSQGSPQPYRSKWAYRNTLDPAIHQGIFHFLRGRSLVSATFDLEAVAAFDCVLHSLQYLDWSWAPGNPRRRRADLCRALGFGEPSAKLAEHVYFLRNQFAAHAGGWRWWDWVEYFEDDLASSASRLSLRALRKAADIEPQHRSIDPTPDHWATWFEAHFPQIWGAIWFREP